MSLKWITKYILNKSVKRGKVNDFEDFNSIGKVVWEFISSLYDSGWDTLYVDNTLFRSKVTSKFTSKINNVWKNKESKETEKLASVSSLPPSIPVKSPKKVKDIAKYFKKITIPKTKKQQESHTLKLCLLATTQGKFWRLKKYSQIFKVIKLKISKKSSTEAINQSPISIWPQKDLHANRSLYQWTATT